jgi:galactose mutarotase-like enzyme
VETLTNDTIRLQISSELGAKIVSLVRRASGYEFLLQSVIPPETKPYYGEVYDERRSFGFDECVPTVDPCTYPGAPFAGAELPDHGEVWSIPWKIERRGAGSIKLSAGGRALPYRFEKEITLEQSGFRIVYAMQNESDTAFHYNWSAHPLLRAREDTSVSLPSADGPIDAFSVVPRGSCEMRFTRRLNSDEGWCSVTWPDAGERLRYSFDPARVPYIGLWITNGGWPPASDRRQHAIALEPCLAPNSLASAIQRDEAPLLAPLSRESWELRIRVA